MTIEGGDSFDNDDDGGVIAAVTAEEEDDDDGKAPRESKDSTPNAIRGSEVDTLWVLVDRDAVAPDADTVAAAAAY